MSKILLRKEIECVLRAILYPESNVVLVCKNDGEAQKCINDLIELIDKYKIIQPEISEVIMLVVFHLKMVVI